MFCPKCETEYRQRDRCPDCGRSLVPELPARDHPEPALLLATRSLRHAWHIQSLLEGCGIASFLAGSTSPQYTSVPSLIYVRANDLARAQEILAGLAEPSEVAPAAAPDARGDEASPAEKAQ